MEILVAAALFLSLAAAALHALRLFGLAARLLAERHAAYAQLEGVSAHLRAEARSALAIWPAGVASGGYDDCDELAFFTTAAGGGAAFWSYRRFPRHALADAVPPGVLLRVSGSAPLAPCSANAPGRIVASGVTAFAVRRLAASQLAAHGDPYDGTPDGPFLAATPDDVTPPLGLRDAGGAPLAGGNALAEVRLDDAGGSRVLDLSPGVRPGGFTALLAYTCNARCAVGHAGSAPQTLTGCAVQWTAAPGWPVPVYAFGGSGPVANRGVRGWLWDGTVSFRYFDALFGQPDTLARAYELTTWSGDAATSIPVAAGAFPGDPAAPADVRAWVDTLAPAVLPGLLAPVERELDTCMDLNAAAVPDAYLRNR